MDDILQAIAESGIRFVRLVWCDNANIIRAKAFHAQRLEQFRTYGIGISMAQQALPAMFDAVAAASGLGPVGEAWLAPDWSTFNRLPYAPGHARVMANMVWQDAPWPLCPRYFLQRMIDRAAVAGFEVKAAFEHEFYLFHPGHSLSSADQTVFASTLGMDINYPVIDAIAEALLAQEIPVECYYPESGPGQQEISIRYTSALQAADWAIAFRETVRGVALQHGLRASFLPKIFADSAGNGCHLHLSLWQQGENQIPGETGELSDVARSFVAGLLHHLPALMAITTPSPNSYRRLQPHFWSGAYRCWGIDNREAAVRVPSNSTLPSPTHIELKTVDASANPYLALGAAIAAGLDGIALGLPLNDPVQSDPGYGSDEQRQQQGIDRLPSTLEEAIAHLRQNAFLHGAMGAELATAFLAVRQAEWDFFKDKSLDDEVNLLLERY